MLRGQKEALLLDYSHESSSLAAAYMDRLGGTPLPIMPSLYLIYLHLHGDCFVLVKWTAQIVKCALQL